MFGYVRAVTSVLDPADAQRYEAVYCGLCRTLGDRYGKRAQLVLNYDFVFLAILLAQPEEPGTFPCCGCTVHPWKKKTCWLGSSALAAAADATVILTWWKLQDAIRDGALAERMRSRLAALALRSCYRTAAAYRPAFDKTVRGCLAELHQLEQANTPSLDRPADTFARILQAAATETPLAARTHGIEQILYHVGRWIYLADAWDDLAEDRKKGNYNPLLVRRPGRAGRSRPAGDHARLPGPGGHRLFPAGLGGVGGPAGPHPLHRSACGGGGRLYRPVEEAEASISSRSRGRACARTEKIRRT